MDDPRLSRLAAAALILGFVALLMAVALAILSIRDAEGGFGAVFVMRPFSALLEMGIVAVTGTALALCASSLWRFKPEGYSRHSRLVAVLAALLSLAILIGLWISKRGHP